jgi:hypothetical protein
MRNVLIAATWLAIAPAGVMAQTIAPVQRPTFTPPTVAPQAAAPLASGNYTLSIVLPPKQGTSGPFVRHFPATLVHTGVSVVLNLAGRTPLQGTLNGNSITLHGAGPSGSTMTFALTTVSTGASGTVVIYASPTQQASGTSTLERTPTGGPASNMRGHDSDENQCAYWVICILRDYWDIIIGPIQ